MTSSNVNHSVANPFGTSLDHAEKLKKQQEYIGNYLYKPKRRTDRSEDEISYEKNKDHLTFKPTFYTS